MDARSTRKRSLTSLELCAGAGGQALGLARAGFRHVGLIEYDKAACETLTANRRQLRASHLASIEPTDLREYADSPEVTLANGVDLVAAGVPCPPFSLAGKRLGIRDDRNLFPAALKVVERVGPRAVIFENVRGLLDPHFESYRLEITHSLRRLGFEGMWCLVNAAHFGVPQVRLRAIYVGLRRDLWPSFVWRPPNNGLAPTVGDALYSMMASSGWSGAKEWKKKAAGMAPTLVGGSHKHGGPDLGPTRAKKAWAELGVNAHKLADAPPTSGFRGAPHLTVEMAAVLQGFPRDWKFAGGKTAAYRQVGNAFPPPVAENLGRSLARVLRASAETVLAPSEVA
jgi:DNA (cytosine-5)-methyltransferase 1